MSRAIKPPVGVAPWYELMLQEQPELAQKVFALHPDTPRDYRSHDESLKYPDRPDHYTSGPAMTWSDIMPSGLPGPVESVNWIFADHDPGPSDQAAPGTVWLNTVNGNLFVWS